MADLLAFLSDLATPALFETWAAAVSALLLFGGACAVGLLAVPSVVAPVWLRALAGFPLFFVLGGTIGILVYLAGGSAGVALLALLAGAMAAMIFALWSGGWPASAKATAGRPHWTRGDVAMVIALLLLGYVFAFFGWGETNDGTIRVAPGAWGDGALHTLNAEAFSRRAGGDLSLPAFAGEVFREPFGYDFVAGMLRRAGWTVGAAFTLPAAGLLACLLGWTGYVATLLVRNMEYGIRNTKYGRRVSRSAFLISCFLLLFGNGLQWLVMATRTASWSPGRFFGVHVISWDKVEEIGLVWSLHLNTFSSQKHFLLAAAFLSVLAGVLFVCVRRPQPYPLHPTLYTLLPLAVATGFLPLFHAHGFLAAGLLWLGALRLTKSRVIVLLGVLILALALPAFIWYAGTVTRSGFTRVAPGYLAPPGIGSWVLFWFVNLGLFLPLALLALLKKEHQDVRWILGLPAGALFVLGNIVQLQPYHWDNYKVFLFGWLLLLPLVTATMTRWAMTRRTARSWPLLVLAGQPAMLRVAMLAGVVFIMCLTTLSEVATYLHFRVVHPIYTSQDRVVARALDAVLPRAAVVLAATDTVHNHHLTLTGRNLVVGYGGWLWSRGLAWQEHSARMRQVLTADSTDGFCDAALGLSATHVVVGDAERREELGRVSPTVNAVFEKMFLPSSGLPYVVDVARLCGDPR